jgi:ferredoxin
MPASSLTASDLGFVSDFGFRFSNFNPTPPRRFDLLSLPFLGRLLRSLRTRRALQFLLLLIAVAVMADGFFGPQISPANLSGVLPWTWWRALTVVALLAAGNLFCMACPFMLPRELGRRLGLKPRNWPRFLRSKWLAVGLLLLFFWAYEAFGLWDKPIWTAWLILNYFLAAFVLDAFFRGASFCKYVCPIGQFQFINSLISPLEVKVRHPAVCTSCRTHDCLRGNQHHRGCETSLFLPRKVGNLDCTFCLDCVRACPHDNIGLQAVAPGSDLIRDPARSSLGQFSRRTDIAALALVLVFAAFASAAAMADPVSRWLDRLISRSGLVSPLPVITAFFLLTLVLVPTLTLLLAVRSGRVLGKLQTSARELFCRFSLALVPLGAAMWAAHFLFHFLVGYRAAWPLLQQTATGWGLSLGRPDWSATGLPFSANTLLALQTLMLDVGLLLSLYVGWRIATQYASLPLTLLARSANGQPAALPTAGRPSPLGLLLPWALVAITLYAIGLWILLQPMQMRGLIASSP